MACKKNKKTDAEAIDGLYYKVKMALNLIKGLFNDPQNVRITLIVRIEGEAEAASVISDEDDIGVAFEHAQRLRDNQPRVV
jgi:hypothetical protein